MSYVKMAEQAQVVAKGDATVDPASGRYVLPMVVSDA